MKRDLELIRKIILAVEDLPTGLVLSGPKIDGYTDEQIGYHNYLIIDAGLAKGEDTTCISHTSPRWMLSHLTSAGHDFADAARNDTTWNRATSLVKEKTGSTSLDIFKEVLVGVIKTTIGI